MVKLTRYNKETMCAPFQYINNKIVYDDVKNMVTILAVREHPTMHVKILTCTGALYKSWRHIKHCAYRLKLMLGGAKQQLNN